MRLNLTPVQSRYVAVALLFLALTLLAVAVVWPTWWLHSHYDAVLDDYTDKLARYRRVASLRPEIERAIAAAEKSDGRKYYLKGPSITLAAAELQGMVTKVIDTHKGRVVSSQVLQSKDDGKSDGATKVSLSVNLNATIIPLQMIVHTIETQEPYLFIDQLTVRANQGRAYRPLPGVQPEFGIQMTVHGYLHAAGAKP